MTIALQYYIKSILRKFNFFAILNIHCLHDLQFLKYAFISHLFFTCHSLSLQCPLSQHHCLLLLKEKLHNIVVYVKQITNINSLNPFTAFFLFSKIHTKINLPQLPQQIYHKARALNPGSQLQNQVVTRLHCLSTSTSHTIHMDSFIHFFLQTGSRQASLYFN